MYNGFPKGDHYMSKKINVKDTVDTILNPKPEWRDFTLKQEELTGESVIIDETITEISIIDLKGNNFKFPGQFTMFRENGKITFKSIE